MPYDYEQEKPKVFTDEGQRMLLKIRDAACRLTTMAGSVRYWELIQSAKVTGDSWLMIACVDGLVELRELKEIKYMNAITQFRIFVRMND